MSRTIRRRKSLKYCKNKIRDEVEFLNDYLFGYKDISLDLNLKLNLKYRHKAIHEFYKNNLNLDNKVNLNKEINKFIYDNFSDIHSENKDNVMTFLSKRHKKGANNTMRVKNRKILQEIKNNIDDINNYIDLVEFPNNKNIEYNCLFYFYRNYVKF